MNILTDWLQQPLAYRAGWTLLHFLWQGSAIALGLAIAQTALRKRLPETRYAASCVALALMALAPLATFLSFSVDKPAIIRSSAAFVTLPSSTSAAPSQFNVLADQPTAATSDTPAFLSIVSSTTEPLLPWLTTLWLAGVSLLSIRLLGGWFRVQRLRFQQTEPLGEPWLSILRELQLRLEITRPVRLLQSALVEVPTVIGWLKPVILLPASALTGLSPEQLESILAHELAHIRRNDYLVNLLQRVVETVLFYHPAVWWVSNCIRQEREHCCDDWAVRVCGDRVDYARALASLEQLRFTPSELALAASDGSLMQRIQRLLQKSPPSQGWNWRRIAVLLIVGAGLCLVAARPDFGIPPALYRATVRLELSDRRHPPDRTSASDRSESSERDGLTVELEWITSRPILHKVIEELNLGQRFAQRHERQAPLSTSEVYSQLRRDVSTRVFPHTSLVEVAVVSEDAREAAEIANGIARVYRDRRLSKRHANEAYQEVVGQLNTVRQELSALSLKYTPENPKIKNLKESKKQLEADKERMEQEQPRLLMMAIPPGTGSQNSIDALRRQLVQHEQEVLRAEAMMDNRRALVGEPGRLADSAEPEAIRIFERQRAEVEIKLNNFETLLIELRKLPPDQIANAIPSTSYPDPRLNELLNQLGLLETQRAQLLGEFGEQNTKIMAINDAMKSVRHQIDARVNGIIQALQAEVNRHKKQIEFLTESADEARKKDAETMAKYRPFLTAKSDWETKKRIYETINLRLLQETIDSIPHKESGVEIVDPAEPALRSIGRRWFWRN